MYSNFNNNSMNVDLKQINDLKSNQTNSEQIITKTKLYLTLTF